MHDSISVKTSLFNEDWWQHYFAQNSISIVSLKHGYLWKQGRKKNLKFCLNILLGTTDLDITMSDSRRIVGSAWVVPDNW